MLFDAVISKFPDIDGERYLTTHADIVHSKHFENGIWKIQGGKEKDLKVQEKIACKELRVVRNAVVHVVEHEAELDFASEVLSKRARVEKTEFMDTRYLLPTSNICERYFSLSGLAFSDLRKRTSPVHLEEQLFLKLNRKYWDLFNCDSK